MSDTQQNQDPPTDSQETYYDKSEDISNSGMLNESQDFALIDYENSEEIIPNQINADDGLGSYLDNRNPAGDKNIETQLEAINGNPNSCAIEKKTNELSDESNQNMKHEAVIVQKIEVYNENTTFESQCIEDEDDVIQGTPPEIHSSPCIKKPTAVGALKRKAEATDEPASKIPRTLSPTTDLKLDRANLATNIANDPNTNNDSINNDILAKDREFNIHVVDQEMENHNDSVKTNSGSKTAISRDRVIIEESEEFNSETIPVVDESNNDKEEMTILQDKSSPEKISIVNADDPNATSTDASNIESDSKNDGQNEAPSNVESDKDTTSKSSETAMSQKTDKFDVEETMKKNIVSDTEITKQPDAIRNHSCEITESNEKSEENHETAEEDDDTGIRTTSDVNSNNSTSETGFNGTNNSRMSIEVVYDRKSSSQEKNKQPMELVEIDEEDEAIVLDSSHEDYRLRLSTSPSTDSMKNVTVYKSCLENGSSTDASFKSLIPGSENPGKSTASIANSRNEMTNGDEEDRKTNLTDKTVSCDSDICSEEIPNKDGMTAQEVKSSMDSLQTDRYFDAQSCKKVIPNVNTKIIETIEAVNITSDSENECLIINESAENNSQIEISSDSLVPPETIAIKRKMRFYVDLSYLLHVDKCTKAIVGKEFTDLQCEPMIDPDAHQNRNIDNSGFLADISGNDNKDSSPGSVISNPQHFQLPGSRLSIMSTSSSASSAASLATKLSKGVGQFSVPKGPAKHARKPGTDINVEDKQNSSESLRKINQEWKNSEFLKNVFFQSVTAAVHSIGVTADQEPSEIESGMVYSTPEPPQNETVVAPTATPKSTKAKRAPRKTRAKGNNSRARSNSTNKTTQATDSSARDVKTTPKPKKRDSSESIASTKSAKVAKNVSTPKRTTRRSDSFRSRSPSNESGRDMIEQRVFAMWADKNYYPGKIVDKIKDKYKVKFDDGGMKNLLEGFIIPISDAMPAGTLVCANVPEEEDYSRGIILKPEIVDGVQLYTVELEDGEKVDIELKDLFLMPDQAETLRETINKQTRSRLPHTPKHLGEVSLDNLVDGKRRSRRAHTPNITTPRSRKEMTPRGGTLVNPDAPSISGTSKTKTETNMKTSTESESKTSDADTSVSEEIDGIQPEMTASISEQVAKGPPSRMKGRGRSKAKLQQDDSELGPIPPLNSNIFKDMSFLLTCAMPHLNNKYTDESNSEDTGTENEDEWLKTPFIKDRLKKQLINGGGKVYDFFKNIPSTEYKNTKLITNVRNSTANSIQCLSVGIASYSHSWVIDCCKQNKLLKIGGYQLAAGWSKRKRALVEMYDRPMLKPLNGMVIGMPKNNVEKTSNDWIRFWSRICENMGAAVVIVDDPAVDFSQATAILADNKCPPWIVEQATRWEIPVISKDWIMQCLIEGQSVPYDAHPSYKYDYIQS